MLLFAADAKHDAKVAVLTKAACFVLQTPMGTGGGRWKAEMCIGDW